MKTLISIFLSVALTVFAFSFAVSAGEETPYQITVEDGGVVYLGNGQSDTMLGGVTNFDYVDTENGYYVDGVEVIDGDSVMLTSGGGGLRVNNDNVQVKQDGGEWTDIPTSGAFSTVWSSNANNLLAFPRNGADGDPLRVVVGGVATTSAVEFEVIGASLFDAVTASGNIDLDGGTFTYNDSSADKDARFESNGEAYMFFIDAGNDRIGIATSAPTVELEVDGDFRVAEEGAAQAFLVNGGTKAVTVGGALTVTGTLTQTGAATLASTLTVDGASTLTGNVGAGGTLTVTGATVLSSTLAVTSAVTLSSTLSVDNTTINGSLVVNEASEDVDFRVEGNNHQYLIFGDGTNDRIGFGTSTPAYFVDIANDFNVGTTTDDTILFVDVSASRVGVGTSTPSATFAIDTNAGEYPLRIGSSTGEYMTMNASGELTQTNGATFSSTLAVAGNVSLNGGTFIFNESSADVDFRFEGNGDANLLYGDAGNDRVAVGTSTPTNLLHVEDDTATSTVTVSSGGSAVGARIILEDLDGAGCTEVSVLNGAATWKSVTCPTGI